MWEGNCFGGPLLYRDYWAVTVIKSGIARKSKKSIIVFIRLHQSCCYTSDNSCSNSFSDDGSRLIEHGAGFSLAVVKCEYKYGEGSFLY